VNAPDVNCRAGYATAEAAFAAIPSWMDDYNDVHPHSRLGPTRSGCADITYLPMRRDFLYLVAIMDWFTRKVLALSKPISRPAE
jgi:transposase InsO family protein